MWRHELAAAGAGLVAGTINAVVGSGSLVSFPVLMMLGLSSLDANVTSTLGLVAGNLSSIPGYRRHLGTAGPLLRLLLPACAAGGLVGALLLFALPSSAFDAAVPVLVGLALVLVAVGPWVNGRVSRGHAEGDWRAPAPVLVAVVFAVSAYGGYFGAAQGVLQIALLGLLTAHSLQVLNATKVVTVFVVNIMGSAVFLLTGRQHIHWPEAAAVAAGSLIGGILGARVGSRLSPRALRAVILVIGTVALAVLLRRLY